MAVYIIWKLVQILEGIDVFSSKLLKFIRWNFETFRISIVQILIKIKFDIYKYFENLYLTKRIKFFAVLSNFQIKLCSEQIHKASTETKVIRNAHSYKLRLMNTANQNCTYLLLLCVLIILITRFDQRNNQRFKFLFRLNVFN